MMRSRFACRLVTGISIVMLLLCQVAAAAKVCVIAPQVAAPANTAMMDALTPCHQDTRSIDGGSPDLGCQDRCPSRYASFETAKVNIPAVDSLALPVLTVAPPAPATMVTAPYDQVLACAAPPPLHLVYCRLLI